MEGERGRNAFLSVACQRSRLLLSLPRHEFWLLFRVNHVLQVTGAFNKADPGQFRFVLLLIAPVDRCQTSVQPLFARHQIHNRSLRDTVWPVKRGAFCILGVILFSERLQIRPTLLHRLRLTASSTKQQQSRDTHQRNSHNTPPQFYSTPRSVAAQVT